MTAPLPTPMPPLPFAEEGALLGRQLQVHFQLPTFAVIGQPWPWGSTWVRDTEPQGHISTASAW